jgi:hypothetical protein
MAAQNTSHVVGVLDDICSKRRPTDRVTDVAESDPLTLLPLPCLPLHGLLYVAGRYSAS